MTDLETIGILCGGGRQQSLLRVLPRWLRALPPAEKAAVFVFSMAEVWLPKQAAEGTIVTEQGLRPGQEPLPAVIYNITVQHRRENIRKMRALIELPGSRVLNPTNEFSHRAVREMLLSDPSLQSIVPPEVKGAVPDSMTGFVRRPLVGMRASRLICGCRTAAGWKLFGREGAYSDPDAAVTDPSGESLTLRLEETAMPGSRPDGIRSYVQKNADGEWEILCQEKLWEPGHIPCRARPETEDTLLAIARRVGCYQPDMAMCTVDLLCNEEGSVWFLGMGGWPPGTAPVRRGIAGQPCLLRNMLGYSRLILHN